MTSSGRDTVRAVRVEVVRSARRRKTVQARKVDGVLRVSIPAGMTVADEERWVAEMVRRMERRAASDTIDLSARADGPGAALRPAAAGGHPLGRQPGVPLGELHTVRRHHPHFLPTGGRTGVGAGLCDRSRAGPSQRPPSRPPFLGAGRSLPANRAGPGLPHGPRSRPRSRPPGRPARRRGGLLHGGGRPACRRGGLLLPPPARRGR